MLIVTWNVHKTNLTIRMGLNELLRKKPDVICLQEVPYEILVWLRKKFSEYKIFYTSDWIHNNTKFEGGFICFLTRLPVIKHGIYKYSKMTYHSFLSDVFYKLGLNVEKHSSLFIDVIYKGGKIRFQGMRLSCAVGPSVRRHFIQNVFKKFIYKGKNVVLGDLNITSGKLFNISTGLFKGNKLSEIFFDERPLFNSLVKGHGLTNIFSGQNTMYFFGFRQQLDHILIPENSTFNNIFISKTGFGSDHKMLFADAEF